VQKGDPSKIIESDGDKALGRRRSLFLSNNQPKDGVPDGGGIGEDAGLRWKVWGGILLSFGAMA
jgi:hypothetical protein